MHTNMLHPSISIQTLKSQNVLVDVCGFVPNLVARSNPGEISVKLKQEVISLVYNNNNNNNNKN